MIGKYAQVVLRMVNFKHISSRGLHRQEWVRHAPGLGIREGQAGRALPAGSLGSSYHAPGRTRAPAACTPGTR